MNLFEIFMAFYLLNTWDSLLPLSYLNQIFYTSAQGIMTVNQDQEQENCAVGLIQDWEMAWSQRLKYVGDDMKKLTIESKLYRKSCRAEVQLIE